MLASVLVSNHAAFLELMPFLYSFSYPQQVRTYARPPFPLHLPGQMANFFHLYFHSPTFFQCNNFAYFPQSSCLNPVPAYSYRDFGGSKRPNSQGCTYLRRCAACEGCSGTGRSSWQRRGRSQRGCIGNYCRRRRSPNRFKIPGVWWPGG